MNDIEITGDLETCDIGTLEPGELFLYEYRLYSCDAHYVASYTHHTRMIQK